MFDGKIEVASRFQSSVNIAFDLPSDDKIRSFIPTASSIDIIEDVFLSVAPNATQRARILIGAYGRGKSHIILVLMSLLYKKDMTLFADFLAEIKKTNFKLYDYVRGYIDSERKLLPVIISGSSTSLTQSFLSALQQTLSAEGLDDLMPETHFLASLIMINTWRNDYPETYTKFVERLGTPIEDFIVALKEYDVASYERFVALYPDLTSGSTFNPFLGFDVVELYEKVVEKLRERGFDGVYIIYDEFSKYLESSIANASISDIKLLQDFAEKCDRSGGKQMHLLLICHKDIANYIDSNLPKEKVDGWRGVSGRFKHIAMHNNFAQMYDIISAVIKKEPLFWDEYIRINAEKFNDLCERFGADLLGDNDNNTAMSAIKGCYPLHPISTFILPRLSEKVAQNERTLFTFLSSKDKYTLSAFLASTDGTFPMLTPDYIYDYFEPLLRKEPYTSETHKLYKLTSTVLRKVDPYSLDAKIVKFIALLYIIEQYEKLPPVYDVIVDAFRDSVEDTKQITIAINSLIENDCVVYLRRSNNYLKLKESSGVDIPGEIRNTVERNRVTLRLTDILNQCAFDSYMYPTRYNDAHEITRYFDFLFIDSADFWNTDNWEMRINSSEADGVVFAVIPRNDKDIKNIKAELLSGHCNHDRIVFVVPNKSSNIDDIAFEYRAVLQLRTLAVDDDVLADEYDIYIEDLEEVINSFISSYARPENGGAEYFYNGQRQTLYRKAQMSALLSRICAQSFPHTPVINNESVNKNNLPTVAINSRNKILHGLLGTQLEPNLGLSGTGQDVSIMRSTLIRTGVLLDVDSNPTINMTPADADMANVLTIILEFISGAGVGGGQNFRMLYDRLTLPQYGIGLRYGVIPIYIAAVLHLCKNNLVVIHNGNEVKITPDLLNSINERPSDYYVVFEDWNEEKAIYIAELETIFRQHVVQKEKAYNNFAYIFMAMNRWYMSLPKYAKEMKGIYRGTSNNESFKLLSKSKQRFIASLKQPNNNSRQYLFEKVFAIFGMREFSLDVLEIIRNTKREYDNAVSNLVKVLTVDVKSIFAPMDNAECSLTSAIKDWYESIDEATVSYLYPRNENAILSLMGAITNDDVTFIQRLCKAVTSLRVDDWNAETITQFLQELHTFKATIDEFNKKQLNGDAHRADIYKIIFTDSEGNETTRSFNKTKYSDRATLLLNEITTALEEMGQSITEQEKRQVLVEILEKMC